MSKYKQTLFGSDSFLKNKKTAYSAIEIFTRDIQYELKNIASVYNLLCNQEFVRSDAILLIRTKTKNCIQLAREYTKILKLCCGSYDDNIEREIDRFYQACENSKFADIPFEAKASLARIYVNFSDLQQTLDEQLTQQKMIANDKQNIFMKYLSTVKLFIDQAEDHLSHLPDHFLPTVRAARFNH